MSEKMYPIPFRSLMNWILEEHKKCGEIFGVHRFYKADPNKTLPIFGEKLEMPFGPAAGPNTQLAQNIISAYLSGARFFELKTVQQMDGADMSACIPRPCILAQDEGYNVEWSTELKVPQALGEYIKAWCALKVLSKKLGLGDPNGFVFNMSVGYDLTGIQSEKVNNFIENLKDASDHPVFRECLEVLTELFPEEKDFIAAINPRVCRSVTLSTLHGCPPEEIERIASYLITEKKLHTYVKCNPTILGYEFVRNTLDSMGYGYVSFDDHHFREDLQYEDAIPMFRRLRALADTNGLEFGLKLSNTFPVEIRNKELPGEEMYMSGRALFPLTIEMAARISKAFEGKLRLSYSGGADFFIIDKLFDAGIWPITVATVILKPGGYNCMTQMAEKLETSPCEAFSGVNPEKIAAMSKACHTDPRYVKAEKKLPSRKITKEVPLIDCFSAPCKNGCPIEQDIPEYLELCRKGMYFEALRLITEKNPLPFITGTICYHRCTDKCSRSFYESHIQIREAKLAAAAKGFDALMASIQKPQAVAGKKVAIIGGGPAGMAAAYFLGRSGIACTIFERDDALGGVVRRLITASRISQEAIDKDIALVTAYGTEVRLNTPAPAVSQLKEEGYTHILFATGGRKAGMHIFTENGLALNDAGRPGFHCNENVYAAGDVLRGTSSVVEAIADAARFAQIVIGKAHSYEIPMEAKVHYEEAVAKKGIMADPAEPWKEGNRCLNCQTACQNCADACPNRANVVVKLPDGRPQILHVDKMCNECGNCTVFCPYASQPCKDKFTIFQTEADMEESQNKGFLFLPDGKIRVRMDCTSDYTARELHDLNTSVSTLIETVRNQYSYLYL